MIDEKIFDFAYLLAFRDATLRKAFPKGDDDDSTFKHRKEIVFYNSKEKVRRYVDSIFQGKDKGPIEIICSLCDDENKFSFGNAQKLVNMTAKYMYITTYNDESKRDWFSNCHCPMDGHMIDCVNNEFPKDKILISWSKMTYDGASIPDDYVKFQSRVKELAGEEVLPIEFDYINW